MSYRNDPRWMISRFDSECAKCQAQVKKGEPIFYYPATRTAYCKPCGDVASADFQACAFDERTA